jgi:hypothetical protein
MISCASTDNPYDDWVFMSTSAEKSLGASYAKQLEEQIGVYDSDTFVRYVDNVGSRVAIYSDRPDLDYKFHILDNFQVNALALPGGYIYTTRGLLKEMDSEAELAGVLAHEIAHVAAYHAIKRQQWSAVTMLSAAAVATQTGGRGLGESLVAQQMMIRAYTRSSESQSDRLGLRYMAQAGYSPMGLINFLETLQRLSDEIPQRDVLFMRTHPFIEDRIRESRDIIRGFEGLTSDTPLVARARYQRHKRRFLFKPDEEVFLKTYRQFFDAYRNRNLTSMRSLISPKFHLGSEESGDTVADFMATIRERVRHSRKIEYDNRLMELDVGDTQAKVIYEFTSRRWPGGSTEPTINDGLQEMTWQRDKDQWRLIRLR